MAVSQVGPRLFLSGLDPALNPAVLSSRNVTLIVNCSGLEGVSYPPRDGLRVLQVPVQDRPHAPLARYFHTVADSIHHNASGATLVHCTAGRSRSPALVLAYLIRYENLDLLRAHRRLLQQRPSIRPNAGFWRQLMEYEESLLGRNSIRMVSTAAGVLPHALDHHQDHHQDQEGATDYCLNL